MLCDVCVALFVVLQTSSNDRARKCTHTPSFSHSRFYTFLSYSNFPSHTTTLTQQHSLTHSLINVHTHSQVGVSLSYALWAVSHSFPVFVLARVVAGVSKGNIGISTAVVVDVTTVEKRNRGMVRLTVFFQSVNHKDLV